MLFGYAFTLRIAAAERAGAAPVPRLVRRVTGVLAAAGRMAASNYLARSVVLMVLLTGYGFGPADDLPPLAALGAGVLVVAAQYAGSAWWLRWHPYGPVEWVLRAAIYRTIPPWRQAVS